MSISFFRFEVAAALFGVVVRIDRIDREVPGASLTDSSSGVSRAVPRMGFSCEGMWKLLGLEALTFWSGGDTKVEGTLQVWPGIAP